MGGKRTRRRNLFYLCLAYLIFLSLSGCALLKEKETVQFKKDQVEVKQETPSSGGNLEAASKSLSWAKILIERQDYEAALKECQKALALSGKSAPGDDAVFNMGLIYAHHRNPKKDYGKSLAFFKRLTIDYPNSDLREEARIWIGMLQENEKLNQEIQKLNRVIEESKKVDIEIEEKKRDKAK